MTRIGLYFGSFNPVHVGHMIIANHMAHRTDLDKVWMVVSPHNPFKAKKSLARNHDRLHLVRLAIGDNPLLEASDIEFSLPQPSYTIDTMTHLKERYPEKQFSLIMGGDNLVSFHKWKNYERLLENHRIYVYKRPSHELPELAQHPQVTLCEAPLLEISSSYIRKMIAEGESYRYLVPDKVYDYLMDSNMYHNLKKD